ncbi:MAG: phosphoribosyltransferase [Clostridiales bacterium]|nr:phosphoribosyltransferase [Clostridiales bacterium]
MFRDRHDAGRRLAELLGGHARRDDVILLGIPRGGVVVGGEIARLLDLPLDVVVASKIGAPGNPEYAVGAVDADGRVTPNPAAGYEISELERLARGARERVSARVDLYRGGRIQPELAGMTAIVVDDGIATGLTALAALRYVRSHGAARVILAAPVIAAGAVKEVSLFADEVVAVERPKIFYAVGQFYREFGQTSDDEVLDTLEEYGLT